MGKIKRKYLKKTSESPQPDTKIVNTEVAKLLTLFFGFKNLDVTKKPFVCTQRHGAGMLYVIKTLSYFSKVTRTQIGSFKNVHLIPNDQIKQHKLETFAVKAPSGKLHQLGRKNTPERIIGYYDSQINLFQVCLFDLNHNLSD